SVILHPTFDVSKITLIPLAAAVALSNAILKTLKIETELKWPNDITLNGKKAAGMIIDATVESSSIDSLILGIGINFKINPKEVEKKIKSKENFYGVATLLKIKDKKNPSKLVQSFLEELEKILMLLNEGKTNSIISQWTKRSSTVGRDVSISTQNGKIIGKAVRLDRDGSLIVKQNSRQLKVTVGDVVYKK
ncbi:MAG TPA: biotin--[acetyl-CoA-carboxylase] ligase, partial [Candidatus Nitrosotenuis sp.]|nr:biotin--[acetyl-CoA-carboxylase] ligase [Candidatus Nitrosotenuis sp.]